MVGAKAQPVILAGPLSIVSIIIPRGNSERLIGGLFRVKLNTSGVFPTRSCSFLLFNRFLFPGPFSRLSGYLSRPRADLTPAAAVDIFSSGSSGHQGQALALLVQI